MFERDLIKQIALKAHRSHPDLIQGIGDDCAVFSQKAGSEWLISTDMLVEGIHFDTSWHRPLLLGRKSLAVNISDIAAMGAKPKFALLSVGLPGGLDTSWVESFVDGVLAILDEHKCVLIGGDTVSSKHLTISVTVLGTASAGRAIHRTGAAVGDSVYVSGALGSSAAGLHLCRNGKIELQDIHGVRWENLIAAHLDPTPRVELAEILADSGMVTAMQDISDGIATDLSHICTASGVSAVIEESLLPAHRELVDMCKHFSLSPKEFQLKGGEDYELVFTVKSGEQERFEEHVREKCSTRCKTGQPHLPVVTRVGEISSGKGVQLMTRTGELVGVEYQGYEHSS